MEKGLRDYQKKTIDDLNYLDEKGNFSTIINLPTGAGKTRIAISFIHEKCKRKNNKFLWLCDRVNLLEQSYQEVGLDAQLICASKGENIPHFDIAEIDPDKQILFASVQTIQKVTTKESKLFNAWIKNADKVYVIYDEAHHIGASKAEALFYSLLGNYVEENDLRVDSTSVSQFYPLSKYGIIGMTATVYRGDKYLDAFNYWL